MKIVQLRSFHYKINNGHLQKLHSQKTTLPFKSVLPQVKLEKKVIKTSVITKSFGAHFFNQSNSRYEFFFAKSHLKGLKKRTYVT